MIRMFVRHRLADYAAWRDVYDEFDEERRGMGVTHHAVFRSVADPNDVTVWHDFASQAAADSFASLTRLREVMQRAGVQDTPEVWFATPA